MTKREQRQRLIDSFVNAVYLYEDKIILTFNYKDGAKTITLAEVEGSDLSVLGALFKQSSHGWLLFLLARKQEQASGVMAIVRKYRKLSKRQYTQSVEYDTV